MGNNRDLVFRFTVGEKDSATSSIWRLWFNRPDKEDAKSDVYLSYRFLGGKLKLSIHESEKIQYSYTGNYANELDIRNQQRHIDKWQVSYTDPLFKIIVPYTELRQFPDLGGEKIFYLPKPDINRAIEIYLYITKQSLASVMPDDFSIFQEETLANKNILALIWRSNPITRTNKQLYLSQKGKLCQIIKQKKISGQDLRGYFFLNNEGKERGFIDLAL